MKEENELEIFDSSLDNINNEADQIILNAIKNSPSNVVIYEVERTAAYKGVRNCNDARDLRHVKQLALSFAKSKEQTTGLKLIEYGWRSWSSKRRSGKNPWPSNKRWCRSYITAQCYAVFEK